MREAFALALYREFLKGKSISELSAELGIAEDRVERRIRAAAVHLAGERDVERRHEGSVLLRIVRRF
jgi:hypothetical protein